MMPQPTKLAPIPENHRTHLFHHLTEASFEQVGHADQAHRLSTGCSVVTALITCTVSAMPKASGIPGGLPVRKPTLIRPTRATQKHLGVTPCSRGHVLRPAAHAAPMNPVITSHRANKPTDRVDHGRSRPTAALFRKLAANFETCVCALCGEDWLRDDFIILLCAGCMRENAGASALAPSFSACRVAL
jgi:hypothetical protein